MEINEVNKDTIMCEIKASYDQFRDAIVNKLTKECRRQILERNLSSVITEIEVVTMHDEETPFRIIYTINLNGVFIKRFAGIKYNESMNEKLELVIKNAQYDLRLVGEYPDEFRLWSFMHTHENVRGDKFCDLLVWPNTTKTGVGGGDYEVKRIKSEYVQRYWKKLNESIASYADALSRMLNYRKEFEKLINETEEKNNDKRTD